MPKGDIGHGRYPVPFTDLTKCLDNKGKEVRVTLRSGRVFTGAIWSVMYPRVNTRLDPVLYLRTIGTSLVPYTFKKVRLGNVQPFKASNIVKFEYLWEIEAGAPT
jgi:hypothetical protein